MKLYPTHVATLLFPGQLNLSNSPYRNNSIYQSINTSIYKHVHTWATVQAFTTSLYLCCLSLSNLIYQPVRAYVCINLSISWQPYIPGYLGDKDSLANTNTSITCQTCLCLGIPLQSSLLTKHFHCDNCVFFF